MPATDFDQLAFARSVLVAEAEAVRAVAERLGPSFAAVVDALAGCRGRVAVCGVGKSADVGQKIVGTLNSTGTRSYLLDATRAVHGDLGMLHPDDVALLLSHSGESEELVRLLGPLKGMAAAVVAVCGNGGSSVAKAADAALVYGPISEACPLALAPSTSTTVMLALGDALAFTLSERRQFTAEQFARFHPAGSLGRQLAPVERVMRRGAELRLAAVTDTVRSVFAKARHHGRRTGAVMLLAADGTLAGLFTDSDLARLFETRADGVFDRPVSEVMTTNPITVNVSARMSDVTELLRSRKISELPVVDDAGRPVGLLDITDLFGLAEAPLVPPSPPGGREIVSLLVPPSPGGRGEQNPPARGGGNQQTDTVMTPTERLSTDLLIRKAPDDLREKALRIELLVLDVDGVLTDGSLWYTNLGDELKRFHVRDGLGLKLWQRVGGRVAILSGRESKAVTRRAKELGLYPIIQGCDDKAAGLAKLLAETEVSADRTCGMGDDLPDLPFLTRCGLSATVGDAAPEVQAMADHVTAAPGGRGAVREAIEWLLKVRGQWAELVEKYQVSG